MLAGLPSTVNERKYGARLMEFVKGEAETLLETIDIDVLTKEGGDKAIFAMLDEKYLPQPRDLLQSALKGFFYDLTVKGGESYAQFYARFDAALRKLKEQDIDLPEIVKGFMLIKKLKLESQQESMILTTTGGDMELKKVVEAVKNVFPEGKGSTRSGKEVFMAETEEQNIISEASGSRDMVENEVFEVAEIVTDPYQDSGDEEEALEVFESYAQVRRKLQERRKDRGFSGGRIGDDGQQWKLQGTVRGRLELLKAKTKCHLCRKTGHWKRECPERHSKGVKPAKTEKEVHVADAYQTEVLVVNDREKQDGEIWSMFQERAVKATHWKTSVDVQQDGNADTHATGNQQILLSEMQFQPNFTAACPESPAPESFRHFADIDEFEVFVNEPHPGVEVLSAQPDVGTCESVDSILGQCAVPDTACRRSLIGEYTLGMLERHLRSQGYRVIRRRGKSEFKFGNNETLISWEDALIPACIGGNHVIVRVAVLPLGGSRTPLLLSKEFLRQMNVVIDTSDDTVLFKGFGVKMKLKETARGHYAIPMFDMSGRDCFVVAVDECDECDEKKKKREHRFDISQLEKTERQVVEEPAIHRDSADPCDHVLRSEHGGQQQSDGAADDGQCGVQGWHESAAWRCDRTGQHSRSGNGRRGRYMIPSNYVPTEGKYHKNKLRWSVAQIYEMDKGYCKWVRSHISQTSSMEMQKLSIYISNRDDRKKLRIEMEVKTNQEPVKPKMVRPEPRNMPKICKTRLAGSQEQFMKVDQWSMVSSEYGENHEQMKEQWKHMTQQLLRQESIRCKDMQMHLEQMDKGKLAKFMMGIIHP